MGFWASLFGRDKKPAPSKQFGATGPRPDPDDDNVDRLNDIDPDLRLRRAIRLARASLSPKYGTPRVEGVPDGRSRLTFRPSFGDVAAVEIVVDSNSRCEGGVRARSDGELVPIPPRSVDGDLVSAVDLAASVALASARKIPPIALGRAEISVYSGGREGGAVAVGGGQYHLSVSPFDATLEAGPYVVRGLCFSGGRLVGFSLASGGAHAPPFRAVLSGAPDPDKNVLFGDPAGAPRDALRVVLSPEAFRAMAARVGKLSPDDRYEVNVVARPRPALRQVAPSHRPLETAPSAVPDDDSFPLSYAAWIALQSLDDAPPTGDGGPAFDGGHGGSSGGAGASDSWTPDAAGEASRAGLADLGFSVQVPHEAQGRPQADVAGQSDGAAFGPASVAPVQLPSAPDASDTGGDDTAYGR